MRWVNSIATGSFLTKAKRGSGSPAATPIRAVAMTAAVTPIAAAPKRPRAQRRIAATAMKVRKPEPAAKASEPACVAQTAAAQITKAAKQAAIANGNFFRAGLELERRVS